MSLSKIVVGASLALASFVGLASAHSWAACADYRGDLTATVGYNPSLCKGFPRDFETYGGSALGEDRGFNYQPKAGQKACLTSVTAKSYSTARPMASLTAGQNVRVVWPAKNHDAETCTNPYIPDTTMQLYMDCGLTGDRNPTVDSWAVPSKLVIDWKANGGKGFQNCPAFCNNTDKAACFEDFTVPSTIAKGTTCSFMWYWVFNRGDVPYTTCFEACIGGGCAGAVTAPPAGNLPPSSGGGSSGTLAPTAASACTNPAATYQQCGGINWNGSKCCNQAATCKKLNDYYFQCLPN